MELNQLKIGENIAALRKAKGLTQEQLAAQLGISAPAVSKWETNASCPDIALLCPLARALGTNVDTLLQFEETLSDQEVVEQINAIIQTAMQQGCPAAEEKLQELLHRYPHCAALQFNAAAAYDTFQMFSPEIPSLWKSRKKALLEELRASGSSAYWQSATIQLASLALSDGDPEQCAALLRELPERVGDPTSIWALYYLKKDQPEEALKLIQKQLYKLVNQTQTCLVSLMNPKLLSRPGQLLHLCQAYRAVSQTFGLADMSDAPMMEAYLQMGEFQQAADCFARYVDIALGPVTFPDEELFSPGLTYKKQEGFQATTQPLRRLLLQSITTEEKYRPLFEYPVFAQALEKLKASV